MKKQCGSSLEKTKSRTCKAVLLILGLLISSPVLACGGCDEAFIKNTSESIVNKNRIPPRWLRERIFNCTRMNMHLEKLDELDKDLIFMRAVNREFDSYLISKADNREETLYSTIAPEEKLRDLHELINRLYGEAERQKEK